MAFQQALSGLQVSSKSIDVISNNIANSSTIGFKASQAHFADVFAASLQGTGASTVGIGASLSQVAQQFTQGNISSTGNSLDISVNGGGFFRMSQEGTVSFTRNGQFHLDKSGYIVNDQSLRLTGYLADAQGVIVPSTPGELQVDASDISPVATGSSVGGLGFTGVRANLNLDSSDELPSSAWAPLISPGPDGLLQVDADSINYSTALSTYDALGNSHTMTMYFVKLDTANAAVAASIAALPNGGTGVQGAWDVYVTVDNTDVANVNLGNGAGAPRRLFFNGFGQLAQDPATSIPYTPVSSVSIDLNAVATDLAAAGINTPNAANSPLAFDLDFTGSTQFGSASGTNRLEQDGYASGRLSGVGVSGDGIVQGRYSNGQTRDLGQIVLANFTNPNGLSSMGNSQWAETSVSGAALIGAPGSSSLGLINASTIEESNVDLTAELVNMITAQRNYQANAQSIKTQDQLMNTLINLR